MTNMKHYENLPLIDAWTQYHKEYDAHTIESDVDFTEWLVDHEYNDPKARAKVYNARFVRIDCKLSKWDKPWTEWFCLDEVWVHPYNRTGRNGLPYWDKAEEFQKWCDAAIKENPAIMERWRTICPSIKIGGAVLNDGWGSDIDGRICNEFGEAATRTWGDRLEEALRTGEVTSIRLDNGTDVLETTFTPFESITPDPDSVEDFGEWADAALEGLR